MKGYRALIAFLMFACFMLGVNLIGAIAGLPYPFFWKGSCG